MNKFLGVALVAGLALVGYMLIPTEEVRPRADITLDPTIVAAEGKVETLPGHEVQVGAELTGRIQRVFVNEGDVVRKGQVIAKLEDKDILAKLHEAEAERIVAQARLDEVASGSRTEEIEEAGAALRSASAELDLAKANLDRYRSLSNEGLVPRAMLDEKQREFEVARNRVQEAAERKTLLEKGPRAETIRFHESSVQRAEAAKQYLERLLEKTVVTAPISGTVIHKNLHDGEVVYTENPLAVVVIADTTKIRISAEVDESDSGRIHVGDPVDIRSDAYPELILTGEIQEIADYVGLRQILPNNPAKNLDVKVVQVRISLPPGTPLKLGMTVDVRIKPKSI
jgi:ABC exporter DevB family membrane fusion protein